MKTIIVCLLLLAGISAYAFQSGSAPFCVLTGAGDKFCDYYTVSDCQSAAQLLGGICTGK